MPDASAAPCTFSGTAAAVRVQGFGPAVLLERAPFEKGNAARVVLEGAVLLRDTAPVGPSGLRQLVLERPAALIPVQMNGPADAYDVAYVAGPPVVIRVAAGGSPGAFRGELPGTTDCAAAWCDIAWSGNAKTVTLERATAAPLKLTGAFPFTPDPLAPREASDRAPRLDVVTLRGARGELRCGDAAPTPVDDAEQVWKAGEHRSLALEAIELTPEGLRVVVANERAPERSAPPSGISTTTIAVSAAAGVLVILAAAAVAVRRKRRRASAPATATATATATGSATATATGSATATATATGSAPATAPASAPASPLTLFYSYAPEDARLRDQLEKHLKVLERRGKLRSWHNRLIVAGADYKAEVDARLEAAYIILLLISKDFLASDYLYGVEMERALARHAAGQADVIAVLLGPCLWEQTPIAGLKLLPEGNKPVSAWGPGGEDAALDSVAHGISQAIDALLRQRAEQQG